MYSEKGTAVIEEMEIMNLQMNLVQKQVQRLALTPKMQQAIKVLQLTIQELDTYLQQELEQNPVLEVTAEETEQQELEAETGEVGDSEPEGGDESEPDLAAELDEFADAWSEYTFENTATDFSIPARDEAQEKANYIESLLVKKSTLTEHLKTQLRLSTSSEEELRIGEWLIEEIDEHGYFVGSIEACAEQLNVPVGRVEKVLRKIQGFDPTGVGARDLRECLLIQLDANGNHDPLIRRIISEHMQELERRQYPRIAKAEGISVQRVQQLAQEIAKLEPRPGRNFWTGEPQYIIPDVIVKKVDDEYVVIVNDDDVPRIRISPYYYRLIKNGKLSREARTFLQQKYNAARWLVRNIEQRRSTIYKVTSAIMEVQREFLEKGPEYLKPLTLQEIADKVGMHESTISRVTNGKYVDTPQGIFELKYFFNSGIPNHNGDEESSASITEMIKQLIENEDKRRPLSDQKITDILRNRGISIARRTVTKYREAAGILPSKLRREY